MTWIFYALLAPIFHAVANIVDDRLADRRFVDTKSLVFYGSLFNLVFVPVIFLLDPHFSFRPSLLGFLALLGAINVFYLFPYYKALQSEDTSVVASLFALARLFIPVFAFFFVGERLPAGQYAGFVIIVLASALLTFDPRRFRFNKSLLYMLVASGMITAESVVFKYLFEQHYAWGTVLGGESLFSFLWTLTFLLHPATRKTIISGYTTFKKSLSAFFTASTLTFAGIAAGTYAISLTALTLEQTIESFQPFFVLLIAVLFRGRFKKDFHERTDGSAMMKKIALFLAMLFGIWLMTA